jgi:hypothetical protein
MSFLSSSNKQLGKDITNIISKYLLPIKITNIKTNCLYDLKIKTKFIKNYLDENQTYKHYHKFKYSLFYSDEFYLEGYWTLYEHNKYYYIMRDIFVFIFIFFVFISIFVYFNN